MIATYDAVAKALVDVMAEGIDPEGEYLYLTGSLTVSYAKIDLTTKLGDL